MKKFILLLLAGCGVILSCNSTDKVEDLVKEDVKEAAKKAYLDKCIQEQLDMFNDGLEEWYNDNCDSEGDIQLGSEWVGIDDINGLVPYLNTAMNGDAHFQALKQFEQDPKAFIKDYTHYSETWLSTEGQNLTSFEDYYDNQIYYTFCTLIGLREADTMKGLQSIATFIHGRGITISSFFEPYINGMEQLSSPGIGSYWRTETNNGIYFTKVLKNEDGEYNCKTSDNILDLNE